MANDTLSGFLKRTQTAISSGVKSVQAQTEALKARTMTAVSTAQQAITRTLTSTPPPSTTSSHQTQTQTATQSATRTVTDVAKGGVETIVRGGTKVAHEVDAVAQRARRAARREAQRAAEQVTREVSRGADRAIETVKEGVDQYVKVHEDARQTIEGKIGRPLGIPPTPPSAIKVGADMFHAVQRNVKEVTKFNRTIDQLKTTDTLLENMYKAQKPLYDSYIRNIKTYEKDQERFESNYNVYDQKFKDYESHPTLEKYNELIGLESDLNKMRSQLDAQYKTINTQNLNLAPLWTASKLSEGTKKELDTVQKKDYNIITRSVIDGIGTARLGTPPHPQSGKPVIRTEDSPLYWTYDLGSKGAQAWQKKVVDPLKKEIDQRTDGRGVTIPIPSELRSGSVATRGALGVFSAAKEAAGHNPEEINLSNLALGAVGAPSMMLEMGGMVLPGAERWGQTVRSDQGNLLYMPLAGLTYMGAGMVEGFKEDPEGTVGLFAGTAYGPKVLKVGTRATVRTASRLSPGYERGMTPYTGVPRVRDVITGDATVSQYLAREPTRFTPPASRSTMVDPALSKEPQSFYHATSDIFGELSAREKKVTVDADKPSVVESSLYFGPPSMGLARFLPADGGAFIKVRAPVRPYSERVTSLIKQGAPKSVIEPLVYREFHQAPKGEIVPGVKPAAGKTFKGELQWEYMAKPGTELHRVQNWRTRLYDRFGMTKGTSWTRDPVTGRPVEVYEFSLDPQPAGKPVKPIVDVPGIRRSLVYSPTYEKIVFGTRKLGSALKTPLRLADERAAERSLVREMQKKGIPKEDIEAFRAGVRLGRAVRGMESPVTMDVILDALTEIGPKYADDLRAIIKENPSILYGSGIATGQTPRSVWWRGFKDLDIFLDRRDIPKFIQDAKAMYKRHGHDVAQSGLTLVDRKTGSTLLDVHEAPKTYPIIGKKGSPYGGYEEPTSIRPFSFMPDELLRGPEYLQEYLYTQAQRKITSLIEQLKEGKLKPNRAKDIGDSALTVEALLDYAESMVRPGQVLKPRKYQKMRADLEIIKNNPKLKGIIEEAYKDAQKYREAVKKVVDIHSKRQLGRDYLYSGETIENMMWAQEMETRGRQATGAKSRAIESSEGLYRVKPEDAFWHDIDVELFRQGLVDDTRELGGIRHPTKEEFTWTGVGDESSVSIPIPRDEFGEYDLGKLQDIHTHPYRRSFDPMFSVHDIIGSASTSSTRGSLLVTKGSSAYLTFRRNLSDVELARRIGLNPEKVTFSEVIEAYKKLANQILDEEISKVKKLRTSDALSKMSREEAIKYLEIDLETGTHSQRFMDSVRKEAYYKTAGKIANLVDGEIFISDQFNPPIGRGGWLELEFPALSLGESAEIFGKGVVRSRTPPEAVPKIRVRSNLPSQWTEPGALAAHEVLTPVAYTGATMYSASTPYSSPTSILSFPGAALSPIVSPAARSEYPDAYAPTQYPRETRTSPSPAVSPSPINPGRILPSIYAGGQSGDYGSDYSPYIRGSYPSPIISPSPSPSPPSPIQGYGYYPIAGESVKEKTRIISRRKSDTPSPRRKRKKKERLKPHWEFGPGPTPEEMSSMLIVPAPRPARTIREDSVLSFGPPSMAITGKAPERKRKPPAKETPPPRKAGKLDDLLYGGLGNPFNLSKPIKTQPQPKKKK